MAYTPCTLGWPHLGTLTPFWLPLPPSCSQTSGFHSLCSFSWKIVLCGLSFQATSPRPAYVIGSL